MPRKRSSKNKKKRVKEGKNKDVRVPINPFALSAMFLNYCMDNGWLVREKKGNITAYYITDEGRKKLPKLGIDISQIYS
ncbi:hypothetical protein DRO54_03260 [Candidatus Bathyarchaeota archaeon]|nr:MAG: hypothetical protein DRO54_03260 [Candidatus Bathyarchaeota archaeon]